MELIQAGQQAFDRGEYHRAIELSEQAIDRNPHDYRARHLKALALFKLGKLSSSIVAFDWLVEKHPQEAEYLSDRGVAHHKNGDNKAALADFEYALLLEPERAYRFACRAYIKDRMGDIEGAVTDYQKAIQLDPEDEIARNNLEITRQKLGYKASKLFKYKSKAHFTEEELVAYEQAYVEKHGGSVEPAVPVAPSRPTSKALLQEMTKVFTSKNAFRDFMRFITKGRQMVGRRTE